MYMYFITTKTVNCYVRTVNATMLVPDVLIITEKECMIIHTKHKAQNTFVFLALVCVSSNSLLFLFSCLTSLAFILLDFII